MSCRAILSALRVLGDVVVGRAGDDQRRAGFVDEDVVDFVDDREVQRALRLLLLLGIAVVAAGGDPHVVAQVVEAELVVRAVGDVAGVGLLPLAGVHAALNRADGEAEARVERAHPFHVAAGEVVVDRDDVDAFAFERVEVRRQRGDERLAFAGDHFGDVAFVQDHAADELHVVVPHAEEAAAALAADGEGFDQDVVERFARVQPAAELDGLAPQLGVGHRLVLRLQRVDRLDLRLQPLEEPGVGRAEQRR